MKDACVFCGKNSVSIQNVPTSQEVKGVIVQFESEALSCSSCKGHYWDNDLTEKLVKASLLAYKKQTG